MTELKAKYLTMNSKQAGKLHHQLKEVWDRAVEKGDKTVLLEVVTPDILKLQREIQRLQKEVDDLKELTDRLSTTINDLEYGMGE